MWVNLSTSATKVVAATLLAWFFSGVLTISCSATNGLDGAAATFHSSDMCSSNSDSQWMVPLSTCMANISFNSSVNGQSVQHTHGRLSVSDSADYYHDGCSDPYYWVDLHHDDNSTQCSSIWPAGGDLGISYWHCVNDDGGDGVCCGLSNTGRANDYANLTFTYDNVVYRSVSFSPRTNSCRRWQWWATVLIVMAGVVFFSILAGSCIRRLINRRRSAPASQLPYNQLAV